MRELTIGKRQGLQHLSNAKGIFTICSADSPVSIFRKPNHHPARQEMLRFKQAICETIATPASAVEFSSIHSAKQSISDGSVSSEARLLTSLEAGDCDPRGGKGQPGEIFLDLNLNRARSLQASGVTIPLFYRPDLPNLASAQFGTATKVSYDCQQADVALFVGPRNYRVPELEKDHLAFAKKKPQLITDTVRQLSRLPIDVLKIEFPVDMMVQQDEARLLCICQQLSDASRVPWVLISNGTDFEVFRWQLEIACKAGASGFVAEHHLWHEASTILGNQGRREFLRTTATDRFNRLAEIANRFGTPWYKKMEPVVEEPLPWLTEDWHQDCTILREHIDPVVTRSSN